MQTAIPVGKSFGANGMIRVVSNNDIAEREKATAAAEAKQHEPVISSLAVHIRRDWEGARDAKQTIQQDLINNLRQKNGEYEVAKLAEIRKQGGSEVYMQLTQIKARTLKAWLKDVLASSDDKPWTIENTPVPDIPPHINDSLVQRVYQEVAAVQEQTGIAVTPDVVQQFLEEQQGKLKKLAEEILKQTAEKMETKIEDDLAEGGWSEAFDDFLENLVTFKDAFMKGPVVRRREKIAWKEVNGKWIMQNESKLTKEWYAPSPFDIYPAPDAKTTEDSYLIERHKLTRRDLVAMKGVPGYSDEAINIVLERFGSKGHRDWILYDQQRQEQEQRPYEQIYPGETIDALQYWGWAQGSKLLEWGMPKEKIDDPYKEYAIEAWLINNVVIRAVINDNPLGRRPYYKVGFERIPGSFWDRSLGEIIEDIQDICNATARALVNNLGLSSGPQVAVNVSRMPDDEDVTEMYPWKVWQFGNHEAGISEPPIHFFQPNPMSDMLIRVFDYFSKLADQYTGLPAYAHGDQRVGGAGNTASGLSMLMGAASKGIKELVSNIDLHIIEPEIRMMYQYEMLYGQDESIKGDLSIIPRGAISLFVKEQMQVRRNEFLQVTNNPIDHQIIGPLGRAEMLRHSAKALDFPKDKIIPPDESIMQNIQREIANNLAVQEGKELDAAGNPVSGQDAQTF